MWTTETKFHMSDQNNTIFSQRIIALKEVMAQAELDALIISHDDEFLSYELNEDKERIKYISGFSGSAGYVVVARNFNPQLETRGIELSNNRGDETAVAEGAAPYSLTAAMSFR